MICICSASHDRSALTGLYLRYYAWFVFSSPYILNPSPGCKVTKMGSISESVQMTQVCLEASQALGSPVPPTDAQEDHLRSSEHAYHTALLQTTKGEHELPSPLTSFCPHPALVPQQFLSDLRYFHEAFAAALTNIVQRWFADSAADFPSRMPLNLLEQQLLEVCFYTPRRAQTMQGHC